MAFFKFRSSESEAQAPASAAESLDVLRQRARQRLVGAAALVLAGVIGFPLVFDTQPRPVALDIPIDIPDKDRAKPVLISPPTVAPADVVLAPGPAEPAPVVPPAAAKEAAIDTEVVLSTSKPVEKAVDKLQEKSGDNAADASQSNPEEAKKRARCWRPLRRPPAPALSCRPVPFLMRQRPRMPAPNSSAPA